MQKWDINVMNKILKDKKTCIFLFSAVILVLSGIIIMVAVKGRKDKEQDTIVYDTDKDTVEEKVKDGLKESDSQDGPALDENNMIDFDGNDSTVNGNKGTVGTSVLDPAEETPKGDKDDDIKDTGSWGTFY